MAETLYRRAESRRGRRGKGMSVPAPKAHSHGFLWPCFQPRPKGAGAGGSAGGDLTGRPEMLASYLFYT